MFRPSRRVSRLTIITRKSSRKIDRSHDMHTLTSVHPGALFKNPENSREGMQRTTVAGKTTKEETETTTRSRFP